MKQPIRESAVLNACIKWLWANGCYIWRNNSGGYKPEGTSRFIKFGLKGSADIVGMTPSGRFLAVECKAPGNKLKPHQEEFGDKVRRHNGLFFVATSIDDLERHKSEILA